MTAVELTVADGIGHIQLNRPEASNTVDMALATGLREAVTAAAADDSVRAVLLTGSGKRFCSGGDIRSFVDEEDPDYLQRLAEEAGAAVMALEDLAKPVVVAVQGAVAGGGLGIMLGGDLIVAQEGTKFVFAYPGIGLTPDCGVSYLLPRAIGQQRALAFALSGRPMSAQEALAQGLVAEVVEDAAARGREIATALAAGAAGAFGDSRRLLRASWTRDRATSAADEARTLSTRGQGEEARALFAKFLGR
ncbi:enoyl-CoA hydratase [Janibacter sp. Soil728]|uniref:enoyl-CoA hydratase/isomerase family protein n=1 Tax=Janibacter sp. Soil728 TaxID=1736393 RepID=UPI0006FBCFA5|nr:enoyl-CoA hydratase/isomerase family protein [Janibacter sp. Soil728]KRE38914.1 enoyl-CoA hydratase [Janibacter sp. Soil728]